MFTIFLYYIYLLFYFLFLRKNILSTVGKRVAQKVDTMFKGFLSRGRQTNQVLLKYSNIVFVAKLNNKIYSQYPRLLGQIELEVEDTNSLGRRLIFRRPPPAGTSFRLDEILTGRRFSSSGVSPASFRELSQLSRLTGSQLSVLTGSNLACLTSLTVLRARLPRLRLGEGFCE